MGVSGCISEKWQTREMGKTKAEIKTELLAEMGREIDALLDWESQTERVTLTDIEEKVLAVRRRFSERLANELTRARVERVDTTIPTNDSTGQTLHRKGKKTDSARHASGS